MSVNNYEQQNGSSALQGQQSTNIFSNLEYVIGLSKFIPSLVIQQLIERENSAKKAKLPELKPMETIVFWADISGFTNLSEACAKKGLRGNEDLAFCINRYMEGMVSNLNKYGGDIIKFVGDAMIVMWPPIDTSSPEAESEKISTIRRAVQCAQDIQKQMNEQQMMPGVKLSVKIGIGYGQCAILYVGGVFNREENFTVGAALVDALKSEGLATSGGQVIVAHSAYQHVAEFFKSKELIDEENGGGVYHLIDLKAKTERVKIQSDAMKLRSQITAETLQRLQNSLKGCVAHCVVPYIQIDQEKWASEIRSLTVMFVSLGVDLSSADSPEGIAKIQKIMVEVQQQVYRMQGSINKLVMDDKGSTLICIWGLQPLAHSDDASRALFCGFNMINALNKISGTYCNIGVSSGECFSGVVGPSGSRKEFSVLGDIVNLAARIMGSMKQQNLKNIIKCDLNTRILANQDFDFIYQGHFELKGKSISTPFFKPNQPSMKLIMASQKVQRPEVYLKLHQNPMQLERSTNIINQVKTVGFEQSLDEVVTSITDYYQDQTRHSPQVTFVKGKIGSGKTAFILDLLQRLHQHQAFQQYLDFHKNKFPIFANSTDQEQALHFLSAWCPILQMLLIYHCKKELKTKEQFIGECLLRSNQLDKAEILCKILGVDKRQLSSRVKHKMQDVTQVSPLTLQNQFVKLPDYDTDVKEEIVAFLTKIFKICIDEGDDLSDWDSLDSIGHPSASKVQMKTESDDSSAQAKSRAPIIIVLDNAHRICPTSWILLESIVIECEKVVILLSLKSDNKGKFEVSGPSVPMFEQVWTTMNHDKQVSLHFVDLPYLSHESLNELIMANASKYQTSYKAEIKDMTKIIDPDNTIKNEETSADWRETLMKKWQLDKLIKSVEPIICKVCVQKCGGNPTISLQYFVNLLHNDIIEVQSNGHVTPTEKFHQCYRLSDWSIVPVPRLAMKISYSLTSKFMQQFVAKQVKGKSRPNESVQGVMAIVLLKTAAVLGNDFTLDTLKMISPFPSTPIFSKKTDELMMLLEEHGFIEVVDCEGNNNICRFTQLNMQDSMFQTLKYKAIRKGLHETTEAQFKNNTDVLTGTPFIKCEKLLQHMLYAQDCKEEEDLSIERRKALTVHRIQAILNHDRHCVILSESLLKRPARGMNQIRNKVADIKHFKLVVLTADKLRWFHNEQDFLSQDDKYIGCVQLPHIYDVQKLNISVSSNEKVYTFKVLCSMHLDRMKKEQGRREIEFSCKSALGRDKWMAAIQYLKTRAIYDQYAKSNKLVNFLGSNDNEESKDQDHQIDMDLEGLLYDFGSKLKNSTTSSKHAAVQSTLNQQNTMTRAGNTHHKLTRQRSSMFRRVSNAKTLMQNVMEVQQIEPEDLVEKLKILYKVSMTSFIHHLDVNQLHTEHIVAGKQDMHDEMMQLPHTKWDIDDAIEDEFEADEKRKIERARRPSLSGASDTSSIRGTLNETIRKVKHMQRVEHRIDRRNSLRLAKTENEKLDAVSPRNRMASGDLSSINQTFDVMSPKSSIQPDLKSIDEKLDALKLNGPKMHRHLSEPMAEHRRVSSLSADKKNNNFSNSILHTLIVEEGKESEDSSLDAKSNNMPSSRCSNKGLPQVVIEDQTTDENLQLSNQLQNFSYADSSQAVKQNSKDFFKSQEAPSKPTIQIYTPKDTNTIMQMLKQQQKQIDKMFKEQLKLKSTLSAQNEILKSPTIKAAMGDSIQGQLLDLAEKQLELQKSSSSSSSSQQVLSGKIEKFTGSKTPSVERLVAEEESEDEIPNLVKRLSKDQNKQIQVPLSNQSQHNLTPLDTIKIKDPTKQTSVGQRVDKPALIVAEDEKVFGSSETSSQLNAESMQRLSVARSSAESHQTVSSNTRLVRSYVDQLYGRAAYHIARDPPTTHIRVDCSPQPVQENQRHQTINYHNQTGQTIRSQVMDSNINIRSQDSSYLHLQEEMKRLVITSADKSDQGYSKSGSFVIDMAAGPDTSIESNLSLSKFVPAMQSENRAQTTQGACLNDYREPSEFKDSDDEFETASIRAPPTSSRCVRNPYQKQVRETYKQKYGEKIQVNKSLVLKRKNSQEIKKQEKSQQNRPLSELLKKSTQSSQIELKQD